MKESDDCEYQGDKYLDEHRLPKHIHERQWLEAFCSPCSLSTSTQLTSWYSLYVLLNIDHPFCGHRTLDHGGDHQDGPGKLSHCHGNWILELSQSSLLF